MTKHRIYDEIKIDVMQATSNPNWVTSIACNLTQRQDVSIDDKEATAKLIKYLFTANHTSPFEHSSITSLIRNVSRSFLAQITRHRMGSFTSASQHYQKYNNYPNILDPLMVNLHEVKAFLYQADEMYEHLIATGIPKEEARQVLPNAKAVNLLWTVNARSLINFFNQRMCRRNVNEMHTFALKLKHICTNWWPELFEHVGPDCETLGGCTQGHMKSQECVNAEIPNFKR